MLIFGNVNPLGKEVKPELFVPAQVVEDDIKFTLFSL
jgi:hypothetical protein